jgi:hypothetical protein
MTKYWASESSTIKKEIARELCEALQELGAKPALLGLVGSYGNTLGDLEVLEGLRLWKLRQSIGAASQLEPDDGTRDPGELSFLQDILDEVCATAGPIGLEEREAISRKLLWLYRSGTTERQLLRVAIGKATQELRRSGNQGRIHELASASEYSSH